MNYKHGESHTKLHNTWLNIKKRCLNTNNPRYKDYGGRGITICPEWTESYTEFRDWSLSNGYTEGLWIDRENIDGNYKPSNCRWVTIEGSNRNQRRVKLNLEKANEIRFKYNSGYYTQKQLSKKYEVSQGTIFKIINNKIWR